VTHNERRVQFRLFNYLLRIVPGFVGKSLVLAVGSSTKRNKKTRSCTWVKRIYLWRLLSSCRAPLRVNCLNALAPQRHPEGRLHHSQRDTGSFCFYFWYISHIIQLTPQQQSAEPRNSAGAEALAVARRPEVASFFGTSSYHTTHTTRAERRAEQLEFLVCPVTAASGARRAQEYHLRKEGAWNRH